jgi:hypothetical protein
MTFSYAVTVMGVQLNRLLEKAKVPRRRPERVDDLGALQIIAEGTLQGQSAYSQTGGVQEFFLQISLSFVLSRVY